MQLFEMQGLLAGTCLPGDMKVNESLAEYLLRKLEDRNELERQLSAKTISEQNIINAFGIKGEGEHSKLVIEYVHGLAIDNADLREVVQRMVNQFAMSGISPVENSLNPASALMFDAERALFMPATGAAIAEIKAHDINLLIDKLSGLPFTIGVSCGYVKEFAANLRAGRK